MKGREKYDNGPGVLFRTFQPESQNFLDPGLAKPKSQLNLRFKNTDLG